MRSATRRSVAVGVALITATTLATPARANVPYHWPTHSDEERYFDVREPEDLPPSRIVTVDFVDDVAGDVDLGPLDKHGVGPINYSFRLACTNGPYLVVPARLTDHGGGRRELRSGVIEAPVELFASCTVNLATPDGVHSTIISPSPRVTNNPVMHIHGSVEAGDSDRG